MLNHLKDKQNKQDIFYIKKNNRNGYIGFKHKKSYYYVLIDVKFNDLLIESGFQINPTVELHMSFFKSKEKFGQEDSLTLQCKLYIEKCLILHLTKDIIEVLNNIHRDEIITEKDNRIIKSIFIGRLKIELKYNAKRFS